MQATARTVTLTIKDQNFVSLTRAQTLNKPTFLTETIHQTALSIYRRQFEPWRKIRLLGVSVSNLQDRQTGFQLTLWGQNEEKLSRLTEAADAIKDRFGEQALRRATLFLHTTKK